MNTCLLFLGLLVAQCPAQIVITGWQTVVGANGADTTASITKAGPLVGNAIGAATTVNLTLKNEDRHIQTLQTATTTYQPVLSPLEVVLRRNAVGDSNEIYWSTIDVVNGPYTVTGTTGTATLTGGLSASMEAALGSSNMNIGSDNIFSNKDNTAGNNNNIERVDFISAGGITLQSSTAFAVFERAGNDGFGVAPILSLSGSNPASYGKLISVIPSAWGTAGLGDIRSLVIRNNTAADVTGTQVIKGLMFDAAGFELAPGTTIYGYSLFPADVTASGANLVDWNNATYFPTNTPETSGGLDLMAYGQFFVPVPEAGSAGLMVMAGAAGLMRRRRTQVGR